MRIIEINVKNFGKLHNFSVHPSAGINIIYGENESGKSTLMAFIKAMLYGLGTGEKRRQYESWDGSVLGGSMEFEHDERTYLLSRTFGATKAGDRISLFNKSISEEESLPSDKEPGEYVLGINVKSFVNTVFVQQSGPAIEGENHEILTKLTNLASAGDEKVSKGEVEKRLKKSISDLDSKKSTAVLPELRKQKRELAEFRAEMEEQLEETDALRESIILASEKKESLIDEKAILDDTARRLDRRAELEEIDALIAENDRINDLQSEFDRLDSIFGAGNVENIGRLLSDASELLEAEKNQEIVIENKKEQLSTVKKAYDEVDKSKIAEAKVINTYPVEVMSAFEEYDDLMREKNEIEISLENQQNEKKSSGISFNLALAICAIVLGIALLLGVLIHWFFVVIGILADILFLAYSYIFKGQMTINGFTDEHSNLDNVNEDLRALNAKMRPVFERLNVKNMEEFDREYKEIERVQHEALSLRSQRENLEKEISELEAELEDIKSRLYEKLQPYHESSSNEEAFLLISRLHDLKSEYEKVEVELKSLREAFEFMLKGRSFDDLVEYGKKLRGDTELNFSADTTSELIKQKADSVSGQIQELTEKLIQQKAELSLKPYSGQDVEAVSDEIQSLSHRIERYEFELDALKIAKDSLNEAFEEMRVDFGPMINYRASRVLSGITGEKYNSIFISEKLVPSVAESGSSEIRNCAWLSGGTFDQTYLSLRLALVGVMSDDKLPVFMDDSLVQFDDDRMLKALSFINEDSKVGELGQTLIFTCHKRELMAAQKLGLTDSVFLMEVLSDDAAADETEQQGEADDASASDAATSDASTSEAASENSADEEQAE